MAYQITTNTTNGYRCSCCMSSWDNSEWVETLEDALEQVPTVLEDGEPHSYNGDLEIRRVSVIDGTTGEEIAWARAAWSEGGGKYSGYSYTCWSGYRPDIGSFETVYNRDHKQIEETWAEVMGRLKDLRQQKELDKARRDLADAQARIENLTP
jgi:hypothetical protein